MLPARFWQKVKRDYATGCWLWTASKFGGGYAYYKKDGKSTYAHRVAYEEILGEVPTGLELDHTCSVRHCVNPDHLEPVTHQENVRRGEVKNTAGIRNREKTHCPSGHLYAGDNLYVDKIGRRYCNTCRRRRALDQYNRG